MALHYLIEQLIHQWKKLILMALIGASLGFVISVVLPREYNTSFEVLIVQKQSSGMDLYTAAKTTEYVGKILSEVITSQTFRDATILEDLSIDKSYFKQDPEKLKKQWENMVEGKVLSSTGVVTIDIYHQDRVQSEKIAQALISVLTKSGDIYLGGTYSEVKVIDAPITSKWTVRPDIFIYSFIGFFLFAILGIISLFAKISLRK